MTTGQCRGRCGGIRVGGSNEWGSRYVDGAGDGGARRVYCSQCECVMLEPSAVRERMGAGGRRRCPCCGTLVRWRPTAGRKRLAAARRGAVGA